MGSDYRGKEMSKRVVEGATPIWLCNTSHIGLKELKESSFEKLIGGLSFFKGDFTKYGYTKVGIATISLEIASTDELLTNKVAALKAEREKLLADTQLKVNHFDKQINQLLAIEMSPEAS